MTYKKDATSASDHSVAVGRDNTGDVFNVSGDVHINKGATARRSLPTVLSEVVSTFSSQQLSRYGEDRPDAPTSKVQHKLDANNFQNNQLVQTYIEHSHTLNKAYSGAEKFNPDARYLVQIKAGIIYQELRGRLVSKPEYAQWTRQEVICSQSEVLVAEVIKQLMQDYQNSTNQPVAQEHALLAISLVVVDSIVDCHVLEEA